MATSQNGWPASQDRSAIQITTIDVNGVQFLGGVRDGDVKTILSHVAQLVNDRVEKAVNPGCWGYSYRPNKNDPNSLSNHSSGTAIDYNAPKHPNGVATAKTFTPAQIADVHHILAEVDNLVRWGGDYQHTVDSMHFEINATPAAISALASKLRSSRVQADAKLPTVDLSDVIAAENGPGHILPGVKHIQAALNDRLGLELAVDGDFGPMTKAAYAHWQQWLGYTGADADGVPGEASLIKLGLGRFRVVV
jgi:hypothetical protein